jgi:hypothetical protein
MTNLTGVQTGNAWARSNTELATLAVRALKKANRRGIIVG